MHIRLLGTAAGGAFPQWNCNCPNCVAARTQPARATPRTQSCIAISADEQRWFLLNASPDLRIQIESFPKLLSKTGVRGSAIEGVLLTNADLDHVLGLFLLREGEKLVVHATAQTRAALSEHLGMERVLNHYCGIEWREPPALTGSRLTDRRGRATGISYAVFPVPGKAPRYSDRGDVVGYEFIDDASGKKAIFLPDLAAMDESIIKRMSGCDLLLIDGTFWSENEMQEHGIAGAPTASEMAHLPVSGPHGSLRQIANLPIARKIYVHINNTNPMLLNDSPQRREVEAAGVEIGEDGMEILLTPR